MVRLETERADEAARKKPGERGIIAESAEKSAGARNNHGKRGKNRRSAE